MNKRGQLENRFSTAFAARLALWDAGGPELTAEEGKQYLADEDADLILAAEYLSGEMTPEGMRAFEDRLVDDDAFQEKIWPLIELSLVPVPEPAPIPVMVLPAARVSGWRSRLPDRRVALASLATVVAFAAAAEGGARFVAHSQEARMSRERAEGRASTDTLGTTTVDFTNPGETLSQLTPAGVYMMRPNTRVTRSVKLDGSDRVHVVDGDLVLSATARNGFKVLTRTAFVAMRRGYFEVVSPPGSEETTVYVYRGIAIVQPAARDRPGISVAAPRRAVVRRDGSVVVDSLGNHPLPPQDWIMRFMNPNTGR
jgi:hypothetical protein